MGKSSIEDKIKDRLLGHEVRVDNEALFDTLGISEQKERNRKFIFWIFGSAGITLLFLAFIYGYNQKDVEQISNNSIKQEIEQTKPRNAKIEQIEIDTDEILKNDNPEIKPNQSIASEKTINLEANNINSNTLASRDIESKTRSSEVDVAELDIQIQSTIVDAEPFLTTSITVVDAGDSDDSSVQDVVSNKVAIAKESRGTQISNNIQRSIEISAGEIYTKAPILSGMVEIESKGSDIKAEILKEHVRSAWADSRISSQGITEFDLDENYLLGELKKVKEPTKPSHWAISAMIGTGIFDQQYTAESDDNGLIKFIENTESPIEYLELGLSAKYYLLKGFYVSAGLRFNQYNTKHSYSESFTEMVEDIEVPRYSIDLFGDTTSVNTQMGSGSQTITYNYTFYNSINQWTIPLELGMDYYINRFFLRGAIGFNTSFMNLFDGNYPPNMNRLFEPRLLKPSMTFQIQPMLGAGVLVSNNSKISLMANYNQTVGSLWEASFDMTKQNVGYGIRLSYDYRF